MRYKQCIIIILLNVLCVFGYAQSNIQMLGQAGMHLDTKKGKLYVSVDSIKNMDRQGASGDLRLRLYFLPEKYISNSTNGFLAGEYYFNQQIPAASTVLDFKTDMPFYEIPEGDYYKTICLEEKQADEYQIINFLNFEKQSEVKYPKLSFTSFKGAKNHNVKGSVHSISGKCIDENTKLKSYPNLKILKLKCRNQILPDYISEQTGLKHLELQMPNIVSLPDNIENLSKLESFTCTISSLKELPASISAWKKLKTMDISYTAITELPETIGELQNLETLKLNDNEIAQLPASFTKLVNLKHLEINNTNIQALPDNLGELSKLQYLDCRHTKISEIPGSAEQLKSLKHLDISRTNVNKIPNKIIKSLDELEYINLSGTSLSEQQMKRIKKHVPKSCKVITKIQIGE